MQQLFAKNGFSEKNQVHKDTWSKAMSLLGKLSSGQSSSVQNGLAMMTAYYSLLLVTAKSTQAVSLLREMEELYHDRQAEGSVVWIEVLTDMILGMLSDPTALCRRVAAQVFRMTMMHQTHSSISLLVKVRGYN